MRVCAPIAALAVLAILLGAASTAAADSSISQNWAGYAAHGTSFQSVSARWRQPALNCTRGQTRYSAMWVGLGGYSGSATALEQIGTELDCNAAGHAVSGAWYELVPANTQGINLKVRPGDLMAASVSVVGRRVTVALQNLSRHRSFANTLTDPSIDVSSADWILEAPSQCVEGTRWCSTLPLADFRHASFVLARAQPVGGQVGTISNSAWSHTRITLGPGGPQFISNRKGAVAVGTARPSGLINGGSSFNINFSRKYVPSNSIFQPLVRSGPTYLRH